MYEAKKSYLTLWRQRTILYTFSRTSYICIKSTNWYLLEIKMLKILYKLCLQNGYFNIFTKL